MFSCLEYFFIPNVIVYQSRKSNLFFMKVILTLIATSLLFNIALGQEGEDYIKVKFDEETVKKIEGSKSQLSQYGIIHYGIGLLDSLSINHQIVKYERVFPYSAKFDERHRKHGLHQWYKVISTKSAFNQDLCINDFKKGQHVLIAEKPLKKHFNDTYINHNSTSIPFQSIVFDPREQLLTEVNDPLFSSQWHYDNSGQSGGTPGADIKLKQAWDVQRGSSNVIVAIIDGGLDVTHEDLVGALWANELELNGEPDVDDDGNGYIDDINGYSFGDGTGNIVPNFHGVHVGGTVGAVSNNGIGVAGVAGGSGIADGVRLMSCATFGNIGTGGFDAAFVYAADNGAVISQNSWGYTQSNVYEQSLLDAIDYFIANAGFDEVGKPVGPMQGGIVIFAAGNSNSSDAYYPGYYAPVMAVASTDHNDIRSSFSNYGKWVDIAAPGSNVLSTFPLNGYNSISGTSMACPHVSGVAALIISEFWEQGITPNEVWCRLVGTTDNIEVHNPLYIGAMGSGRLNAFNALQTDSGIPPDAITDLSAAEVGPVSVTLEWSATGANGLEGEASTYDIRYSSTLIDDDNFDNAIIAFNTINPNPVGSMETFKIIGLSPVTRYYFAIKAKNFLGNKSNISNITEVTTTDIPVIGVTPNQITVILDPEENTTTSFLISNTGNEILNFSIPGIENENSELVMNNTSIIDFGVFNIEKDQKDRRKGHPVLTGSGNDGGDGFGYQWIDSNEPGGPIFSWEDIRGTGTEIFLGDDDFQLVELPFSFSFYGIEKSSIYITSNGYLSFSSDEAFEFSNQQIPNANPPNDLIATFWDDLYPSSGKIHYLSTANSFIVQYSEMDFCCGSTPRHTFQVILYSNGNIKFQYLEIGDQLSATVGIENETGTEGLQVAFNTSYLESGLAILISRGTQFINEITPVTGTINTGESVEVKVGINTNDFLPGNYFKTVKVLSNDPVNPEISVEILLHINGDPEISVLRNELDFGQVFINTIESNSIEVFNVGTDTLIITNIDISGEFKLHEGHVFPVYILAGGSFAFEIIFSPISPDIFEGGIDIYSNAINNSILSVSLLAESVLPPLIAVSPDSLSEALFSGETSIQKLTINNTQGKSELIYNNSILYKSTVQNTISPSRDKCYDTTRTDLDSTETAFSSILRQVSQTPAGLFPIPYVEGFENGHYNDWNVGSVSGVREVTKNTSAEREHSFFYKNGIEGHFHGIYQNFDTGSQPEYISFYVRPGSVKLSDGYFVLRGGGLEAIWFYAYPDGTFYINDDVGGDKSYAYNANQWYRIEFRDIDWEAKDFDYYVDNELVKADIPFRNSLYVNDFTDLDLYNYEQSEAWWDHIEIGTPPINWLSFNQSSGIVPAGSTQEIEVFFNTEGLSSGLYHTTIAIQSNDPVNPVVKVPISLYVTGLPKIVADRTEINFGQVFINDTSSQMIIINNTGTEVLTLSDIKLDNDAFEIRVTSFELQMNESIALEISFVPTEISFETGELTIFSNDPNQSELIIGLTGVGVDPPVILVLPDSLSAALFSGETSMQVLTIANYEGGSTLNYQISIHSISQSGINPNGRKIKFYADESRVKDQVAIDLMSAAKGDGVGEDSNFIPETTGIYEMGGIMYAVASSSHILYKYDRELMEIVDEIPIHDAPYGITWDGEYFWIGNNNGNFYAYTLEWEMVGSFSSPYSNYNSITWNGDYFVIADAFGTESNMYEVDYDGTIVHTYFRSGSLDYIFQSIYVAAHSIEGSKVYWGASNSSIIKYRFIDNNFEVLTSIGTQTQNYSIGHDGENILIGTYDGKLYEVEDGVNEDVIKIFVKEGEVAAGATDEIEVLFIAEGLNNGFYQATIAIQSNDPVNPVLEVPVKIQVTERTFIEILPNTISSIYGNPDPEISYSVVSGSLKDGDTFTGQLSREPGNNVGQYLINIGSLTAGDLYKIIIDSAFFTIIQAPAIITLSNLEQDEDGTPKMPTVTTNPAGLKYDITYNGSVNAPVAADSYALKVIIDEMNYFGSTTGTLLINKVLGLASNSSKITIYPNPSNSTVKISSDHNIHFLSIYNLSGIEVMQKTIGGTSAIIDVSPLSQGTYLMIMKDEQGKTSIQRLIIK